MSGTDAALLAVSGLVVRYGAIAALRGVDIEVRTGEIVSIVGPNGAGKTSLLAAIAGIVPVAAGTVRLAGEPLSGIALEDVVARGIALVPEGRHIFASLTVAENLALGATVRRDAAEVRRDMERFYATFPILGARRRQPAGLLSGGEQQQLAIARALISRPRLLMLDEPSLGLAPAIIDQVYDLLRAIRAEGVTILLVEQNAERAFAISERSYVMRGGEIVLHDRPAALKADPNFDAAYFGIGMAEAAR
jgi:branched-chain amino acid transport system ATP-binding protein